MEPVFDLCDAIPEGCVAVATICSLLGCDRTVRTKSRRETTERQVSLMYTTQSTGGSLGLVLSLLFRPFALYRSRE